MKKIIASTVAAASLFSAGLVQAAGADLSVKGKLRTGACNIVLGNGGVIDLGTIKAADLATDAVTTFPKGFSQLRTSLTITCSTATKFGLQLQDNRAGTNITPSTQNAYGLGTAGGKNFGEHINNLLEATSNGLPIDMLERRETTSDLSPVLAAVLIPGPEYMLSFTTSGNSGGPAAFDQIEASILTSVRINKSTELDLRQEIKLDGSATIELVYI